MLFSIALCVALNALGAVTSPLISLGDELPGNSSLLAERQDALMCGKNSDKSLNGGKCGLGLCCSSSGYCGTTADYCGTGCQSDYGPCKIATPKKCGTGSGTSNGRRQGYYRGSNVYNGRACQRISPKDIDPTKYTLLYYAFASMNPTTFAVVPEDSRDVQLYAEFTALKSKGVKTWIAVGGYDFSNTNMPTHTTWSDMVSTASNRRAFIASIKSFMAQYGFMGVDIDWEFPVDPSRGGRNADTANLVLLVKEMRESFGTTYGISMALPVDYWSLRYFDVAAMQQYVDWFNFMTYDLHTYEQGGVVQGQAGLDEIQTKTAPLWFAGLNFAKVNLGLATYGRGYTLAAPRSCTGLGCPFTGASKPYTCTNSQGVMSLTEIQSLISSRSLTPKLLTTQAMKSVQWADQWMGYDDEETFAKKKEWANDYCFGGTMLWAVDYYSGAGSGPLPVTTSGTCGFAAGTRCGTTSNKCCSVAGYCGDSADHCNSGCQSLFGTCNIGGTTTDGTCGVQNNDLKCGSWAAGPCCSSAGYCGWSADHCALSGPNDLDHCQSGCDSWNTQIKNGVTNPVNPNKKS